MLCVAGVCVCVCWVCCVGYVLLHVVSCSIFIIQTEKCQSLSFVRKNSTINFLIKSFIRRY